MHFACTYRMVIHGRHFYCPICRDDFVMEWLNEYEHYIFNEAEIQNERQLLLTRIGQLRLRAAEQNRIAEQNQNALLNLPIQNMPDEEPPPLVPPREEIFEIDADGNWILQLGPDIPVVIDEAQVADADESLNDMIAQPLPPQPRLQRPPSSLIPNRREANRRRQERLRNEQRMLQQNQETDRDADDEHRSSASSTE